MLIINGEAKTTVALKIIFRYETRKHFTYLYKIVNNLMAVAPITLQ